MHLVQRATAHLQAPAGAVFDVLTDIARLPEWNASMLRVVGDVGDLRPGAEWTIEARALGVTWESHSTVIEFDRATRRFVHRSGPTGPSHVVWTWEVDDEDPGSQVRVTWDLNPRTMRHRFILLPIRAWLLKRREVPASLRALDQAALANLARRASDGGG